MSPDPSKRADTQSPRSGGQRPWVTNLVLLGVVLALGVWVLLGEPQTTPRGITPPMGKVFPHFVASDVTKIELKRVNETLVFSRKTQGSDAQDPNLATRNWRIEAPVVDRADDANINRLINAVEHLRTEKGGTISDEELADYSFGEVVATLTFTRPERPTITFSVGAERPGAIIPVKTADGSIHQVKAAFLKQVTKEVWQYRNRQMLGVAKEMVTGIRIEQRGAQGPGDAVRKTEFVMQEGRWRLGSADGDTVAAALIDAFLEKVAYTRGTNVVADAPSKADLEAYRLDPPRARLTLSWPGDEAIIEFGKEIDKSPQERYGRVPQRPTVVYRVNMAPFYEAFAREAGDYLHGGVFPLQGGEASVDGIEATFRDADPVSVSKVENDWVFTGSDPVELAKNDLCVALAKSLLKLRVRDRLQAPADEATLGFDDPELTITLRQGGAAFPLIVGAPVPGQPGVHNVKRQEPDGQLAFYYTCDLADLPFRLRDALLDLRHPRLFRASSWNVDKVTMLDESGRITFGAEKHDPSNGATENAIFKWKVEGDPRPTDHEQVKSFMKQFDDLHAEKWLALDSLEARRTYGLAPRPRKIVFRVKTLVSGGEVEYSDRTLLLGDRTGERVHAMAEGGPAIGLVDAGFLDRLARGFSEGTPLIEFNRFDVSGLVIVRDGEEVASFKKPGMHWIRDRILIVDDSQGLEDECIKPFERVTINTSEVADDKRLEDCGLKSPEWTIRFTIKSQGGQTVERSLNIGNGKGLVDRNRWASTDTADTVGSWYDQPLRKLQEYLRTHPKPQPPKQPKTPDEHDHKGH